MARPTHWSRAPIADFTWGIQTPLTIWNEILPHVIEPGETLIRLFGNLRFWVNASDAAITRPDDLYVRYVWGLFWDDGSVPNMANLTYTGNVDLLEEHVLYTQTFSMRDAWTPAGYAGVNIGFIDDREDTSYETRARRLSAPVPPMTSSRILFKAQANSVDVDFGINYAPRFSSNALIMDAGTL